jgi:NADH-quinone oxidoreductase subunit E
MREDVMGYFSQDLTKKIEDYVKRFETRRSAILPVLHAIQDERGWIREEDILALEKEFNLPAVDVREVVSFYTMYRSSPVKPYRIEICNSISCWLRGSEKTIETLQSHMSTWKERMGAEPPFEVHAVACLGMCGHAPVGFVNKERHLNVTPEVALKIVEQYAAKHQEEGR